MTKVKFGSDFESPNDAPYRGGNMGHTVYSEQYAYSLRYVVFCRGFIPVDFTHIRQDNIVDRLLSASKATWAPIQYKDTVLPV